MPTPALLLLCATLLPLASFVLLVFIGKRMGNPLAGYVATALIGAAWACSLATLVFWFYGGTHEGHDWGSGAGPIDMAFHWLPIAAVNHPGSFLNLGLYVDSLTVSMFNMITLIATVIHVFSIQYMREDPRFARFFTYLGLFCFSMLALVLSQTLLQIFMFWELVGLCSYLLIGFWYESRSATNAAIKAFVVNRIGDVGFIVGLGLVVSLIGNASLPELWIRFGAAGLGKAISLPDGTFVSAGLLTAIGLCLFCGAAGKSGQFPLHVWLPDAMEGPTPVSALIHAATMVAAGVYLMGRLFPILTPDARLVIAILGCVTLTMAALIALAQTDIKRILAYSTLSQLGYMMLAIGVGSWTGAMFHLITHAFFKALLFLCAGSVIHAAHHEQELEEFGGLWRKIPVTAVCFGVGVLAIAGTPFFSGYYSKEMILTHAGAFADLATHSGKSLLYWTLFILPTITAYLTAFYMMRCWMLTFWGTPRNAALHEAAREHPMHWAPLIALAILAIISGTVLQVREMLGNCVAETNAYCTRLLETPGATFTGFSQAWPANAPDFARGAADASCLVGVGMVHRYGQWAFAVGLALGAIIYLDGYKQSARIVKWFKLRPLRIWLYRGMYFDELYVALVARVMLVFSRLAQWFDRAVIDSAIGGLTRLTRLASRQAAWSDEHWVDGAVRGVGLAALHIGAAARITQTGHLRRYVMVLLFMVAVGIAALSVLFVKGM